MVSLSPISLTASTTLDRRHAGAIIMANAAAGMTLTLPPATGSGRTYTIIVGITVTSNSLIVKVANASDVMTGNCINGQDSADTVVQFDAGSTADTITMDGSTKGGLKGDRIELQDVAANLWSVEIRGTATGTEVTPFSATVS